MRGIKPTLPLPKTKLRVAPPPTPPIPKPCQMCDQTGNISRETCWGCGGKGYYLSTTPKEQE